MNNNNPSLCVLALGLILAMWGFPSGASAQGFIVQPMIIQVTPRPGHTISVPLRVSNTSASSSLDIDIRLMGLTQTPEASWWIVDSDGDTPHQASLLEWTALETSRLSIPRATSMETQLTLDVPRSAHGAYFGALLVETPRPEGAVGMVVRTRFLIPIIAQIKGRPARHNVDIEDIQMTFDDGSDNGGPTTHVELAVANDGRTYSRIIGEVVIERLSEDSGSWYPVSRFRTEEKSIIPGVAISLRKNLERRFPSGDYRLNAQLNVDGRRVKPIEKIVSFEGDPSVDSLAFDTRLQLDSDLVSLDIVPGATRTTSLKVENPGSEAVKVSVGVELPGDLRGVALGDLRGDRYSAVPWLEVHPDEFVIRPRSSRNIRVTSRLEEESVGLANYYAALSLDSERMDGQKLDQVGSMLHLANGRVVSEAAGGIDRLLITEGEEGGGYVVQARFVNMGDVHLDVDYELEVIDGRSVVKSQRMSSVDDVVLPLGVRNVSAEVDFSNIGSGVYLVRVTASYGFQRAASEVMAIEVVDSQGAGDGIGVIMLDEVPEEAQLVME